MGLGQAGELVAGVAGHVVVAPGPSSSAAALESRLLGLLCCLDFYTTPREMGGGALGGSLQRAWRYEAPMTPFLAARCGLMLESLQAASSTCCPHRLCACSGSPRRAGHAHDRFPAAGAGATIASPIRPGSPCGGTHHTPAAALDRSIPARDSQQRAAQAMRERCRRSTSRGANLAAWLYTFGAVAILAASTGFGDHSVVEFLSAFSQFFSFAAWGYFAYRVARWFLPTVAGVRRPPPRASTSEAEDD